MVVKKDVDFSDSIQHSIYTRAVAHLLPVLVVCGRLLTPHGVVVVGTFDCDVRQETKIHFIELCAGIYIRE